MKEEDIWKEMEKEMIIYKYHGINTQSSILLSRCIKVIKIDYISAWR